LKNKISDELISKLYEITSGFFSQNDFKRLVNEINKIIESNHFTHTAEANFLRLINGIFDKISFLKDCLRYPHYLQIIISISSHSNYLTDILVRNPELLYSLIERVFIDHHLEKDKFTSEVRNLIAKYKSFDRKVISLKSIKRKEMLRIGVRDILGFSPLENTIHQLSILAKSLTTVLFDLCYNEILAKYSLNNIDRKYCVAALGKLGGDELNYSSDIDLIVFYDQNSKHKKKEYYEILSEVILLFIQSSSLNNENGFLYRVDFRLRPDGKNSPLCRTLNDYLRYYEIKGEDWERQMLIKASFVCGEVKLFDEFMNYLTPFIYPSSFYHSPLDQIKNLRLKTLSNLEDKQNIKLAFGGIRDIEFTVQALQLLNGGRNKKLRTGNTLIAIEALSKLKLITNTEKKIFTDAYLFYRKIEHYLQLMNDRQTHSLPENEDEFKMMSSYLCFSSERNLKNEIEKSKRLVGNIFNSVFGIDKSSSCIGVENIVFKNPNKAIKNYYCLKEGISILDQKEFDSHTIKAFEKLEIPLLDYLSKSYNPDIILNNFVQVIRSSKFPSIWYEEFTNKKLFFAFLTLCEYSQRAVELFAEDKEIRDFFLSGMAFDRIDFEVFNDYDIKHLLFAVSVQYTLRIIDRNESAYILSTIISNKLKTAINNYSRTKNPKYFVAMLGSIAVEQPHFDSDVDIIIVSSSEANDDKLEKHFIKLLNHLKKILFPLSVDCRLRPEGKSSQLVWNINSYINYLKFRARIWELQALTRIKFIYGDKNAFNKFINSVNERIEKEDNNEIKKSILEMRKKILSPAIPQTAIDLKKSPGCLTDIEFLVQFLILCKPNLFSLCIENNLFNCISQLEANGKLSKADSEQLKMNYFFLKNVELAVKNVFNIKNAVLPTDIDKIESLSLFLGFSSAIKLKNDLNNIAASNIKIFKSYLE
jgi:glutamate-ammonia-ligase adenylyltransferase